VAGTPPFWRCTCQRFAILIIYSKLLKPKAEGFKRFENLNKGNQPQLVCHHARNSQAKS
jgi:hypothetical protein